MVENLKSRVVFILVAAGLAIYSLVAPVLEGRSPFNLGLDLRGGVTLRYRLPDLEGKPEAEARESLQTVKEIFQNRLDATGVKEMSLREIGDDQIEVGIPGVQSHEADSYEKILQSVGRLEFRLAATTEPGLDVAAERERFNAAAEERRAAGLSITRLTSWHQLTDSIKYETSDVSFRWTPISAKFAVDYCASRNLEYDPDENNWKYWELIRYESDANKYFTGEQISAVQPSQDGRGFPAVGFTIRPGKDAANFGTFTSSNIGQPLTILLDGQIQSIANIESRIDSQGVITGGSDGFTQDELRRLIAVIRSGSLPVKPVLDSKVEVGPTLGEAAISRGVYAGTFALLLILVFLAIYYRAAGLVACLSLSMNLLLLLGILAFLGATMTLPGIAGLILTIGMAVDANILIFERIREEYEKGKTIGQAVKSGFEKAFFTIVDANVTTFLTAFFLFRFGTGPIRGFAVILMIGLATSMFSALYFSKTLFAAMVGRKLEKLSMMKALAQSEYQFLRHTRKALTVSIVLISIGMVFFIAQGDDKYGMDFTGGYEVQLQFKEMQAQSDVLNTIQGKFPGADVVTVGQSVANKAQRFQIKYKGSLASASAAEEPGTETPSERFARSLKEMFRAQLAPDSMSSFELDPADEAGRAAFQADIVYTNPVRKADVLQKLNNVLNPAVEGPDTGVAFQVKGAFAVAPSGAADGRALLTQLIRDVPAADGSGTTRLSEPVPSQSFVGPRVGVQLRDAAIRSILFSLVGIILYIRIRFKQYRYGLAACIALVHDVLFTLGAVAAVHLSGLVDVEIDLALIAAFLTIIGYSLNDTIVIFDRVRENLPRSSGPLPEVLNRSINQTLSRTILTSLTTMIAVLILFAFNVGQRNVLEGFAFSLIVGIVVGTYSTVFIASPAVVWLGDLAERRKAKDRSAPATV